MGFAKTSGEGIDFGGDDARASEDMASLAEHLSLVQNPAALPLALAATQRNRTGRSLRVLGDLLLPAGRQEQALEAWHAALEVEPESVSTRLVGVGLIRSQVNDDSARNAPHGTTPTSAIPIFAILVMIFTSRPPVN